MAFGIGGDDHLSVAVVEKVNRLVLSGIGLFFVRDGVFL